MLSLGVSGHSLVDGFGALRLVAAMLGFADGIRIRPYLEQDSSLMHYWAKDNDFSSSTPQSDSPPLSESGQSDHSLLDDTYKKLIATTSDGCPIGCVRFLFSEADTLNKATKATISFTLDRCSHGHNLIPKLIQLSFDYLHRYEDFSSQASTDSKPGIINLCSSFVRLSVPSEIQPSSNTSVSFVDNLSLSPSRITILSDRNSWFNSYIPNLVLSLWRRGHSVRCIHSPHQLQPGDVCLLLSCGSILKNHHLSLHRHNLVVHGSALPQGQGWSPVTWQILEGASSIPVTLFEAVDHLDAGPIYLQQTFMLEGYELVNEWRLQLAHTTISLCLEWFDRYQVVVNSSNAQQGEPSYYTRRRPIDSELDPESSLATQFNLLRVVDNEAYPAFFHWRNQRYDLSIRLSKNSSRP